MIRVEFGLSMPSHTNWSGNAKRYLKRKNLTNKYATKLGLDKQKQKRWYHNFGDSWSACITARVMDAGERGEKSAGFYGYDWMVDNIIWYDQTEKPQAKKTTAEPKPMTAEEIKQVHKEAPALEVLSALADGCKQI